MNVYKMKQISTIIKRETFFNFEQSTYICLFILLTSFLETQKDKRRGQRRDKKEEDMCAVFVTFEHVMKVFFVFFADF